MKPALEIRPIRLSKGSAYRVEDGRGQQVTCFGGVVWLTQAGDERDIVLEQGQSFTLDRKGLAVVYALRDAVIVIGPDAHISPAPQGLTSAERRAAA